MILPPHIAKDITHYKSNYKYGTDKNYNNTCDDIYTVYFSKEKTFLGFRYRKEWERIYKFSRRKGDGGRWEIRSGSAEFLTQMNKIQSNKWVSISPELYERIQKDHPEYLL